MQVAKWETQAEGGCSPRPAQGLLPGAVCVGDYGGGSLSQQGLPSPLGTQIRCREEKFPTQPAQPGGPSGRGGRRL